MHCWSEDYMTRYSLVSSCGSGGEGSTYGIEGQPDTIAKIYNDATLARRFPDVTRQYSWTMHEKIAYMIALARRLTLTVDEGGVEVPAVAWPKGMLFDDHNQFVGFLMPKVPFAMTDDTGIADLHFAYRPRERKYLFGDGYSLLTAIRIATNLAAVTECLHGNDIVVGDFNCNNILIGGQGQVTLIDSDSFCVHNEIRGITYRCVVGVGEFLAPELQGVQLDSGRRSFTKESDCFSLAIHIFMLLMNGTHPFSGTQAGAERRASSSNEPYVNEIATGACPHVTAFRGMLPAEAPSLLHFPYYIRVLIDRAFGYANAEGTISQDAIKDRPTAEEWREALVRLYDDCANSDLTCPNDPTHVNATGNDVCMWCEMEGKLVPLGYGRKGTTGRRKAAGTPASQKVTGSKRGGATGKGGTAKPKTVRTAEVNAAGEEIVGSDADWQRLRAETDPDASDTQEEHPPRRQPSGSGADKAKPNSRIQGYLRKAKKGDTAAQLALGLCYENGDGVEQDSEKAVEWYRQAAQWGNGEAQAKLGDCYFAGYGVQRNYGLAWSWYKKAAEHSIARAYECLRRPEFANYGDVPEAVTQAAGNGTPTRARGTKATTRQTSGRTSKRPRKLTRKDADAQLALGMRYEAGTGVKKDYEKAVECYRNAAEWGNDVAQVRLGDCYLAGRGVRMNSGAAWSWYKKAAGHGNRQAQERLKRPEFADYGKIG